MAINPILPVIIGAIQTRNKIKDINEADYDDVTGQFIDLASAEDTAIEEFTCTWQYQHFEASGVNF